MPTAWPSWVQTQVTQGTGNYLPVGQVIPQITQATAETWSVWVDSLYNQIYQPTAGGTQATVWLDWQTHTNAVAVSVSSAQHGYYPAPPSPPPLTPEQEAERARRRERERRAAARNLMVYRNRERAKRLRRRPAERRAEALLLEHLTESQREEWKTSRAFTVHTATGKRAYRVAYGVSGNVHLIRADEPAIGKYGRPVRVGASLCAHVYHPDGWVPTEDNVLAQALLLQCEGGEEQFLAMANVS